MVLSSAFPSHFLSLLPFLSLSLFPFLPFFLIFLLAAFFILIYVWRQDLEETFEKWPLVGGRWGQFGTRKCSQMFTSQSCPWELCTNLPKAGQVIPGWHPLLPGKLGSLEVFLLPIGHDTFWNINLRGESSIGEGLGKNCLLFFSTANNPE